MHGGPKWTKFGTGHFGRTYKRSTRLNEVASVFRSLHNKNNESPWVIRGLKAGSCGWFIARAFAAAHVRRLLDSRQN
jgi:hypothetical protein